MAGGRSNHTADPTQRVRSFSPRAVPQLWAALLDSVGTDAVRVHTAASIESGKQGFFGPGQLNAAAKVVTDWHQFTGVGSVTFLRRYGHMRSTAKPTGRNRSGSTSLGLPAVRRQAE